MPPPWRAACCYRRALTPLRARRCPRPPRCPAASTVKGTRFVKDGKPLFISGINYWAGPTLARDGNQPGWDQVRRDLDGIQAAGLNMIRTCVATEGPDSEPYRIVPTIQPAMGQYDPAGIGGVMRFSEELQKRGLYAIYMLNNFWQWSGGFAQYLSWAGAGAIPYPPPTPGGSWDRFQHFAGGFYNNQKAVAAYNAFINFLVPKLAGNPMIIWELANEPRGMKSVGAYHKWIDATARMIKSLAPSQLVTTGSEGQTASPVYAGMNVVDDHQSAAIDFICFHMWAANWGWVNKDNLAKGTPRALEKAKKYINEHATAAAKVGKPILLEEFGFPRDGGSYDPASPVTLRDQYLPGGVHAGALAAGDDAGGGHHALGVGGRQPAAAAGAVLEAGRSVHRRSAPRGAGLVQRVRQGRDAEADHRVVAPDHRHGRDVVVAPRRSRPPPRPV